MRQVSFFDGAENFVVNKPIKLIELFAGYGSQHLALKYLGVDVESHRICEWAVKSIQAYKDLHFPNDNTDYSASLTADEVIDYLTEKGISSNYSTPMSREQIKRMGEAKCRQVYNNIQATHNLVNIMNLDASDLGIEDTDKYCYVMTYSFPCQDLSKAGKGKGMAKESGTRSGLLWEVERLLDECNGNLPQVLLCENVPDIIGTKNIKHFAKWLEKLESLGYKCYWQVLNGKDYGIPQNRERFFMVSVLGDYFYDFPNPIELKIRLKHLLETQVDEKFYLSDVALKGLQNTTFNCSTLEARTAKNGVMATLCARDYKDAKLVIEAQCLQVGMLEGGKWSKMHEQSRRYYDADGLAPTIPTSSGGHHEPKIAEPLVWDGFNQQIRADSSVVGTLTKNCGQDLKRNGQGIIEPILVGGIGDKKSNGGTQYYQQDRVYDGSGIAMCHPANLPTGSYMYTVEEPTVINPLKDKTRYGWHFEQQVYDADGITRVVKAGDGSGNIPKVVEPLNLKQQLCNELVASGRLEEYDIVRHSYTNSRMQGEMKDIRQNGLSPTIDTRADCLGVYTNYRIRKLTPKECWRLMGVKDEDFERVARNQSNSSLYHLAGDSIITTVLMAIFGEMVGIDWQTNTEWKYGEETEQ